MEGTPGKLRASVSRVSGDRKEAGLAVESGDSSTGIVGSSGLWERTDTALEGHEETIFTPPMMLFGMLKNRVQNGLDMKTTWQTFDL